MGIPNLQQWHTFRRVARCSSPSCFPPLSPFHRSTRQALYLITTGARESSFRNIKTIAECLADEIINAARGSSNSYAIKKKDEIERVAKANR